MRKNLLFLTFAFVFASFANNAAAQKVFALTETDMFYWFDATNPAIMSASSAVTGIPSGTELVGMDVRPATGEIYILGYNSTTQTAQLFKLDTAIKALSAVGAGITPLNLSGRIGFDFNPTVDRIRVTSSDEHDYRLHPVTGALAANDGILAYAGTDINTGINPNIGASAYTNSYIGSTSTTLYNYDDSLNIIAIQNPPNNGVQNTVGASGIMVNWANPSSDLDIHFNPMSLQNIAYLVANTGTSANDSLYIINLSTGGATSVAALNMAVKDIAVMIDRTAPPAGLMGKEMWALASNNTILKFNSSNPSYITSATPVTGVAAGQVLVGMDMRPVDMKVYAIGYNASTMVARIYTIDATTLMATPVSIDSITNIDLSGNVGVDFNPVADRIRVVTSNGRNYRLNQLTGLIAANDTNLAYNAVDVNFGIKPNVATGAYTNTKVGVTSTTLYVYDDSLNVLATQNPPNAGVLNTIGSSGIVVNPADRTTDMDIYYDHLSQSDMAFLSANAGATSSDRLYKLNLTNGQVMDMGLIGNGIAVLDIVVKQDMAPAPVIANQIIHALTENNELVTFNASNPSIMLSGPSAITGIDSGYEIVGMDVRPATGELYILTYNATAQMGLLYKVDTATKVATAVGTGIPSFALSGKVGFDFNPTVDRIRVVSSEKHDYRLHPVTGGLAAADGMLVYASTDINSGVKPNIGTAAYTNSYIGATSTTLYNYDDSLNVLTTQNPPNTGVQNTIGKSGIMVNWADASSDMDIYFNSTTMMNEAYFVANTSASNDILYMMNLSTGMVSFIGNIGIAIKDIALPIDRVAPVPSGKKVYALTSNNNIISFNSGTPSYILTQVAVSGLVSGETLVGMDVRPVDLKLYGVAFNPTTMVARIYTINPEIGMATPVSSDSITGIDLTGNVGVDFNPVADRLRVVTSNNKNYRLNQLTGTLAANDTALAYATGDANFGVDPMVATVAYTNSKVNPTSTTLYAYDDSLNNLLTQSPPNAGLLNTIGASGIILNIMDKTSDMDIYFDHASQTDKAYFSANINNGDDKFYTLNLTTGAVTEVGMIGWGIAVKDIALQLDSTPLPTALNKINSDKISRLAAYPNPVKGNLTIVFDLKQNASVNIAIIDITGRKVADVINENVNSGHNSVSFNSNDLTSGIYFVTISIEGETQTYKIVK